MLMDENGRGKVLVSVVAAMDASTSTGIGVVTRVQLWVVMNGRFVPTEKLDDPRSVHTRTATSSCAPGTA